MTGERICIAILFVLVLVCGWFLYKDNHAINNLHKYDLRVQHWAETRTGPSDPPTPTPPPDPFGDDPGP